jgi:ribosome biogenesis GTP-binding protein YsxC/EngB
MYHSNHMRGHQSLVARLDNVFEPISTLFEESIASDIPSGRYAEKRREEKFTRPLTSITKYIESINLGSPRTRGEFRALVNKKGMAVRFLDQLKPKTKFIGSAIQEADLPLASLPEIAVVGRSNSGKSTLINAIVGTRCCAVENKPGSTRQLNFYRIGDPPLLTFVDVPGFGFAYAKESTRTQWTEFALWYLKTRRNLRLVILVADARHGLADSDSEVIGYLKSNKVEFRVALNKCDLVHKDDLAKRLTVLGKDLNLPDSQLLDRIIPVSALRDVGVERLRKIVDSYKMKREIVVAGQQRTVMDLLEQRRLRKAQQRADRSARRTAEKEDIFGSEKVGVESEETPPDELEIDLDAYKPDATSILKRSTTAEGDISMLEFEDFVSNDEIENLGFKRVKAPAPGLEESNTKYEETMKLNHSLSWKMQLELDSRNPAPAKAQELTEVPKSHEDLSALGFITTFNPTEIPKGIRKWKVPGLKPARKTSRAKSRPDLVANLRADGKRKP